MGVAFITDPKWVFRLESPKTTKTSELADLAKFADSLAFEVETAWNEVLPELQDVLVKFAYSGWEREAEPASRLRRLRVRLRYTVLALRGEEELLYRLWNSTHRLRASVLDAIERNNPEYQEDLAEAIKDALSNRDGRTMNAEQARERNGQIFDQVFD